MQGSILIMDVQELFQTLDAPFLRYDRNRIEPIVWKANNFLLTQSHEVRVPTVAGR